MYHTIQLIFLLSFVNPNTCIKRFLKKILGFSEPLYFELVLKDVKSFCLLKSTHHLSRKGLRKIYRLYLVLWANTKIYISKEKKQKAYSLLLSCTQESPKIFHKNQIAGMGVADAKQPEKTRKFICARTLNCCLISILYDDDNFFAEAERRWYEWQLREDTMYRG